MDISYQKQLSHGVCVAQELALEFKMFHLYITDLNAAQDGSYQKLLSSV